MKTPTDYIYLKGFISLLPVKIMRRIFIGFILLWSLIAFPHSLLASPEGTPTKETIRPKSLLFHIQYGWPYQYVSDLLYSNFQLAGVGISFEKECGLWPFFNNKWLVESLLLELRFSRIWGQEIELSKDQVSPETWERAQKEGKKPRTNWDHYQIGLIPYYRLYAPLAKEIRFYVEMGLGLTFLSEPLIEEGTQWNFLLSGGLGLDWNLNKIPFYSFVRFEHFSNGGKLWKEGFTDKRVIGPESMILGIGFRYPL